MGKIQFDHFFKKEKMIKEAMNQKERSIEFTNGLNNAVAVWSVLSTHPELKMEGALQDIMDLVKFFRMMKDETDEEDKTTPTGMSQPAATQAVQETFPGSEVQAPPPEQSRIREPDAPATESQRRAIYAIQRSLGRADVTIPTVLTKAQASGIIDKLKKEEAAKGGQR